MHKLLELKFYREEIHAWNIHFNELIISKDPFSTQEWKTLYFRSWAAVLVLSFTA